jgi:hypothetical protein
MSSNNLFDNRLLFSLHQSGYVPRRAPLRHLFTAHNAVGNIHNLVQA